MLQYTCILHYIHLCLMGGGGRNTITISLSNSLDMYSWISLSIYLFAKGRMLSLEYTVTSR